MSNAVIELAEKIEALISGHPDAEEAETACSIAKELASLKAKRSLRPRISGRTNHSLPESATGEGDAANWLPAFTDQIVDKIG